MFANSGPLEVEITNTNKPDCFATLYLGAKLLSYMLYNIMLLLYLHYESEKDCTTKHESKHKKLFLI